MQRASNGRRPQVVDACVQSPQIPAVFPVVGRPRKGEIHPPRRTLPPHPIMRRPSMARDTDLSPRNRLPEARPVLDIEVEHASGTEHFDPNKQIMALVVSPEFVAAWKPVDGAVSVISGQPAIMVRTHDLEIPLTVDEYAGLVGNELEPDEFKALLARYGSFFEIHDDFYDPKTGEAWQPKGLRPQFRAAVAEMQSGLAPTSVSGTFPGPKS
ncbi:hypothetical protein ACLBYM_05265 [Methylobacterium fujisawaense]